MPKIRVLLVVDTVGAEAGTERYVGEIVRRLDRAAFEVHLCCLRESGELRALGECCQTCAVPVERVLRPHGLRQARALGGYIDANGIEIVHTFMPKSTIFGVLAARRSKAAVISSRRNTGYWQTPFYRWLFRYLDRHTTRVLANSEAVKRAVIEGEHVAAEKVDVLYNGVDLERFAPGRGGADAGRRLGIPEDAPVVGIVANYRPVKELKLFVRAAALVAKKAPRAAYLLVGKGELLAELKRTAAEAGIGGRVFFTNGEGEVAEYLGRMSVACLTSRSEGFSNAILEYMAAGLAAVAADAGGNGEAVEDGVTGLLVQDRAPEAFAAAILKLLGDEAARLEMGRRGRERCRERFEIGAAVRRLEEYYRAMAKSR